MASCNGAPPSASTMRSASLNVGLSASEEWRMPSVSNTPVGAEIFRTSGLESFCVLGYGTKDRGFGPLSTPVCSMCTNGQSGTSRCRECKKILCSNCHTSHMSQHTNHLITNLADSPTYLCPSPSLGGVRNGHSTGSPLSVLCDKHGVEAFLFCLTCKILACKDCAVQHRLLHSVISLQEYIQLISKETEKLLKEVEHGIKIMVMRDEKYSEVQHKVQESEKKLTANIARNTNNCKVLLDDRAHKLISEVNKVYAVKTSSLSLDQEGIRRNRGELQRMMKQLTYALNTRSPPDIISAYKEVSVRLKAMQESSLPVPLCEHDELQFVCPDQSLYVVAANFGILCSPGCARKSIASGRGKARGRINNYNTLNVKVYDHLGNPCLHTPENAISVKLVLPDGRQGGMCYVHCLKGAYVLDYFPLIDGLHYLHIKLYGEHILESPFTVTVTGKRDYSKIDCPALVFGEEGGEDGQLCRPWGVCCDVDGNIIVADRSNNRVQIFRPDGTFYHKFGEQGSEAGQFDRPAGIASDIMRRIVVADKDNHRIQVFKPNGEFLFMFGEKGSKDGQFNYPWDVDVNVEGQIIVSDTRNHRIQLFSANGDFIRKFGFENHSVMWKHFDSPRGVCFRQNGEVIVTDFNNHCLVMLDQCLSHPRYVGKEGAGREELTRPQGVCIDEYGYIIVADSRNNRIQIFESNGSQLRHFGSPGIQPGELDRPSGICVSPDGKIIVVDFGNSRIQVF